MTDQSSSSGSSPGRQCVVLAGGLGTRMRPHTETVPKVLLPVSGEPFAAHQLRLLRSQGFTDVVMCVGHLGEHVEDFVGDGAAFDLRVQFVSDGERLRGTAGALRHALDAGVLGERFAVVYGDSYLPIDVAPVWAAFEAARRPVLMTIYRNDVDPELNNVVYRDGRLVEYRKGVADPAMEYVDFGLSIVERAVVEQRVPPDAVVDLATVMEALSADDGVAGFVVDQRYYEVGSPSGLADLERYLASRAPTATVSDP
jgi:NDP-sugar pyrophosphorylase family protein